MHAAAKAEAKTEAKTEEKGPGCAEEILAPRQLILDIADQLLTITGQFMKVIQHLKPIGC